MKDSRAKPVLVVEDDQALSRLLCDHLRRLGFTPQAAYTLAEADKILQNVGPALALLDMRLPDSQGLDAIARYREICPVVILTAYGSVEQAVQAVKAGASDYLIKPVSTARLELAVTRAMDTELLRRKVELLQTRMKPGEANRMVGRSAAFREIERLIGLVAAADTTVLIEGESGVGKELVAASIHGRSPRSDHQQVTIDCATLQEALLESELFGHERGAFTGADKKKEGLLEVAEGGTVFLDEIGEISPSIQAKLLRVLETGRFRRVGGTRDLSVDVRFLTATNRNLAAWVKEGKFREDLYYRLSPFVITVPPLRERRDDIVSLAQHFLDSRSFMRNLPKEFHPATLRLLETYRWPGNIRELRNAVERGLLLSASEPTILPEHLSLPGSGDRAASFALAFDRTPTLDELRAAYMRRMLDAHAGNRARAAEAMGISERTLYRLLSEEAQTRP